CQQSNEDPYTF
nr:immunoglobulin light chain junction region [Mus musculus]NSL97331.1 immunoglobulin light chain junction region [Mus musculus]NSL97548.1 immunoglobulin light chain junction region [Mus musculus]NSL97566.1 immunoglobulin light chain junction region [Mus musculus]NSL98608.1 immunoglobulin light chain junction region [Mus musculus]